MNSFRQAVAGPSRLIRSISTKPSNTSIDISPLPPIITRYVQKQLMKDPSLVSLSNPFLLSSTSSSSDSSNTTLPRSISRRREKQLRELYPSEMLPPSLEFPTGSAPIQLLDASGQVRNVNWVNPVPKEHKQIRDGKRNFYAGRRLMFKGHKHEREKPEREKETEERLEGMAKRIEDWKKSKAETKSSNRPSLPF